MAIRKSTWIISGVFVISVWILGCAIQAGAQTTVISDVLAAWNSHDTEKTASFYTDDILYEDIGFSKVVRGKEDLRVFLGNFFAAFPDTNFEQKSSFVSGDWYCSEWVWSGTHKVDLPGLPATGKRYSIRGVSIGEFKEGRIKRNSDYYNKMDFLQQVGVKLVPVSPPK